MVCVERTKEKSNAFRFCQKKTVLAESKTKLTLVKMRKHPF
jgi:hypothetical protein